MTPQEVKLNATHQRLVRNFEKHKSRFIQSLELHFFLEALKGALKTVEWQHAEIERLQTALGIKTQSEKEREWVQKGLQKIEDERAREIQMKNRRGLRKIDDERALEIGMLNRERE